jgi:phosphoenolpyruvate carboxylase
VWQIHTSTSCEKFNLELAPLEEHDEGDATMWKVICYFETLDDRKSATLVIEELFELQSIPACI